MRRALTMSDVRFVLRRATPTDAASLASFAARTFLETFGPDNDPQHMAAHLATSYGPAQQQVELGDPTIVTLVLEVDADLAGYAMVRRHEPPPCVTNRTSVELWRFYVDQPWHGRGAAWRLMTGVHEVAADLGGTALWLSVWERNARARAFYKKCGFEDVGTGDFWVGGDRQTDRILVVAVATGQGTRRITHSSRVASNSTDGLSKQ